MQKKRKKYVCVIVKCLLVHGHRKNAQTFNIMNESVGVLATRNLHMIVSAYLFTENFLPRQHPRLLAANIKYRARLVANSPGKERSKAL